MTQIVSVINKFDVYDRCVKHNPFMNKFELYPYDNRENVMGISDSYNDFIENTMGDGNWVIFCHQDYAFQEEIAPFLEKMDKNTIYGTVGVVEGKDFSMHLKMRGWKVRKFRFGFYPSTRLTGRYLQGEGKDAYWSGISIKRPTKVESVDCCCLMVHSSLIRKHNLRFDSKMNWHLYSEDFSMNARTNHKISTKVIQIKNQHIGHGTLNEDFYNTLDYFKSKYPGKTISTTCYNGHYENFKDRL